MGDNHEELKKLIGVQKAVLWNACDYARSSADEFTKSEQQPERLKYAVLHLWSAIQLILKSRVIATHWQAVVVLRNKEKPPPCLDTFSKGHYRTLYYEPLIDCLARILEDSTDPNDSELLSLLHDHKVDLETMQDLRNKLEHFKDDVCPEKYEPILATVWQFTLQATTTVIEYIASNVAEGEIGYHNSWLRFRDDWVETKLRMIESNRFFDHYLGNLQPQIDAYHRSGSILIKCRECGKFTVPINGNYEACISCRQPHPGEYFFTIWWEDETGLSLPQNGVPTGHPWNAGTCPKCENRGYFVMTDETKSVPAGVFALCFWCGYAAR